MGTWSTCPHSLGELFLETASRHGDKPALRHKVGGSYTGLTWAEVRNQAFSLAEALESFDIRPGDRVAILSENRPEWALVDLACQLMGAVSVPIYTSLTPAEIRYILNDSQARIAAVSNKSLFEKIAAVQPSIPVLERIIGFDAVLEGQKGGMRMPFHLMRELTGRPEAAAPRATVRPDDTASIIYTSGTTGPPKGVMLTHRNFLVNVVACEKSLRMGAGETHLSFLPLSHVFERTAGHYLMVRLGATIAYAESMDTVPENLLEVRPTFILGVPRFYEKIRDRVAEAVAQGASPLRKGMFSWAKELGQIRLERLEAGRRISAGLKFQLALAERLVYAKFKARLGGRVRFCVSGGAPLAAEIAEFFAKLGVMIYEGYGLTETSPVISVNREGRFRFGTVGIPLDGIEVRISEEGEILTKGPCVMKGYFRKPEETAAVLKNGWFHTGDLGRVDRDGFLVITGRKKELIVTSGGKKVPPRLVEELVEADPFITRCVLYGEGRNFLTALIVPDRLRIEALARASKIAYRSYEELLSNPVIHRRIEERVEERTRDLARFEKIKAFHLVENDFTQSAGELTPTLKVKRDVVISRYLTQLEKLYTGAAHVE
ncbi:MAG: hypothetical protein A3D28_02675 [Omnitrophica bacterium RIFCSPHIGHO2_02_FULL_63_14]|nr:MAG: hypothetical protein A3D28_02675 [Omnitrophica bacterium RIFCSPHIGHO2_02_FULL_63_14]